MYRKPQVVEPNQIFAFIKKHKLALSICAAILGWFLLIVVSFGQAKQLKTVSVDATAAKIELSTLQQKAAKADEILAYTPVVMVVTQTLTSTPIYTPTITLTPTKTLYPTKTPIPTNTPRPTATPDPLKFPKFDGNYLVGVDIAPGVWRSDGSQDDCYWETSTMTGDIVDNYFGRAGGTAYINPSAFAVHFEDCGTWTFYAKP
jgi:hypothetical protein